jgi:hypothetical protein
VPATSAIVTLPSWNDTPTRAALLDFVEAGPIRAGGTLVYLAEPDVFDDVAGAEDALEHAKQQGWTVVSVKADWATVFATT